MIRSAFFLLLGIASPALAAPDLSGTARIDQALAGKTAGTPQQCLRLYRKDMAVDLAPGRILYRLNRSRVYLNVPQNGCPLLRQDRAISVTTPTDGICRGDIFEVIDTKAHVHLGSCAFGEFVPYEAAK